MASLWVEDLDGGRYKIRWRELVAGPDGAPVRGRDGRLARRMRSLTVEGKAARDEVVGRVRRALHEAGEYQPPTASPAPVVTNLEQAAIAWLAWKKTRCKPGSVVTYAHHMKRFFELVRELRGIKKDAVIGSSVLGRDLVIDCVRHWQEMGWSEAWVYSASRSIIDMWRWASDDPARYPGIATPPREAKTVLPRVPIYVAPPAPTLAELDACLRHISADAMESRRIGVLLRFTGLRISQALGMRRQDVDLDTPALTVMIGKSRQEEADQRTIPISCHLRDELAPWAAERAPEDFLFPAWGTGGSPRHAARRNEPFRDAWEEATKWEEARRVVWAPVNRKIARPQHAFRAGFQAFMRSQSVEEEVIDALVGHHGRSIRARHYAGTDTLWDRMKAAMDLLPPVDWRGPTKVEPGKVVELKGRVRRRAE